MTVQQDTRSRISWGWLTGVSNWGAAVNRNFQVLAYEGTHVRVISSLSTPPASPTEADCYIVGANPTGAWSSWDANTLAVWGHTVAGSANLQWINLIPKEGWAIYSRTHGGLITYSQAGAWSPVSALTPAQIATIANLNNQLSFSTWAEVARGLEGLTGNDQLDFEKLKNKPTTITTAQATLLNSALQQVYSDSTISGTGTRGDPQRVTTPLTTAEKTKLGQLDPDRQLPTGGTTGQVVTRTATGAEYQAIPSTGNAFTGVTTDGTIDGTGVDENTRLSVANPFTDEDETKLDGIQTGAQVNRTLAELVTLLNTLTSPGTSDDAKLSYNILKDTPAPGTGGTLRTGNETVDLINAAATTQRIDASKISNLPDATVSTEAPVTGGGSTADPVTLDDDSKAKLGKLTTTQPSFVDPVNYQADMAETNEQSFNFVRNKTRATGSGITEVKSDASLTGKGIDGDLLSVARPFVGVEFTQTEKDKLVGIDPGAKDDQTGTEITAAINRDVVNEADKIDASKIKNLPTGSVKPDWDAAAGTPAEILNKPDIPTVPPNLSTTLAGLRTDINAIPAQRSIDQIISGIEGKTGTARLDATKLKNLPAGMGGGLTEDQVRTLITEQAGERADNLVQAVLDLASQHGSEMGASYTFTNTNAQTVTGAPVFPATGFTLLNIGTFDPIILDNRYLGTLNAGTAGSALDSTQGRLNRTAVEFVMLRNGVAITGTDGTGTEVVYKLQIGRTASNQPLVALTSPTGVSYTADVRFRSVGAMDLGQLDDVSITNPSADHVLIRSGSNWINTTISALGTKVIAALATGSIPVDKIVGITTNLPSWSSGSTTNNTIKRGPSASTPYIWGPDDNDGGSSYTQAQIEEFARDAVADALTAGDNDTDTDIRFSHQDSGGTGGTIKAFFKTNRIRPADIKQTSGVADEQTTWRRLLGITTTQGITEAQAEATIKRLVEDYAEVGTTNRIPDVRLSPKMQDFADALTGDEGFGDEAVTPVGLVGQVANTTRTSVPTLAQARALTYVQYYENTGGALQDNRIVVFRIPTSLLADNTFRLVVESPTRLIHDRYGAIFPESSWKTSKRIGEQTGYTYYYQNMTRIPGSERVRVQRFERITIDAAKFDIGVEDWAREGNTELIPESKLPEGTGGGANPASELLDDTRGLTIVSGNTAVHQPLTGFPAPLTLMATDHGVILSSLQARIASGSVQQIRLGVVKSVNTQIFLSTLRASTARTNDPGTSGNGIQVATFEVSSTAGVAQGNIHCYVAKNAANQVGTYATYVPGSSSQASVAGQIQIDWELGLIRTDRTGGGGGGALGDLTNVTITNPMAMQFLGYDPATRQWVNRVVGAVAPQPVSLPELFVTRLATDPADVLTIRDTRGHLNETLLTGTTFNLFHGGTASSMTAVTGNPFTIIARLRGGFKQAIQRVQINKNVAFTSSASPVSTSMFNADVYYLSIGTRATSEANDFHLYDDAESFDAAGATSVRGVSYNAVRNLISVIDGGTTKRHLAYDPTSGGSADTRYTQALEGDPKYLSWDPDGRHLYVAEDASFKVYDFGASNNPASITIARVTSKEFSVSTWFSAIQGIKVTSSEVLIYGKRFANSRQSAIDRFSKSGTRSLNESDIYTINHVGIGLEANDNVSKLFSIDDDGNHVADMSIDSTMDAFATSSNASWPFTLWFNQTDSGGGGGIIDGRYYRRSGSSPTSVIQTDLTTGNVSTHSVGMITPSGTSQSRFVIAGNFLYAFNQSSSTQIWRSDQSQANPTPTQLTGTASSTNQTTRFGLAILNDRLYVLQGNRYNSIIQFGYFPLTGSLSAGYTAVGSFARITDRLLSLAGSDTYCGLGTDGTYLYGSAGSTRANDYRLVRIDVTTNTATTLRTDGWRTSSVYDFAYDPTRQVLYFKQNGWSYASAYPVTQTRFSNTVLSSTDSFPIGSRAGTPSGIGYNSSADKIYIGSGQRANVYDKHVTGAVKKWVHDSIFDITTNTNNRTFSFITIIGDRIYLWSSSYMTIRSYPDLVQISHTTMPSGAQSSGSFVWNGSFYIRTGSETIREFSPTTGEWIGGNITLSGFSGGHLWADSETNKLFSVNQGRFTTYPLPATGKITSSTLSGTRVGTLSYPVAYSGTFFERNGFLFFFNTITGGNYIFRAYNKTTGARDADEDFSIPSPPDESSAYGFALTSDRLYVATNSSNPYALIYVRAV